MSPHENEDDEELQGCFEKCCGCGNNGDNDDIGPRCMCLPYRDPILISAQVLSILGFLLSFTWWANLALGLLSLVGFQCVWCRRPSQWFLWEALVFALAAAAAAIFSGIHSAFFSEDSYSCTIFIFDRSRYMYRYVYPWMCRDLIIVAILDALLWMATAGCAIAFIATGRYGKWEAHIMKQHNENKETPKDKDAARPDSAKPPTKAAASSKQPVEDKRDVDEETEIATTTTINDGAFAPREMMEQMMDDDSDDDDDDDDEEEKTQTSNNEEAEV